MEIYFLFPRSKQPPETWRAIPLFLAPLLVAVSAGMPPGKYRPHSMDPCSHPPPCLLLEKAICRTELIATQIQDQPNLRARYFDTDGSEITCSSDSLVLCEGASKNLSCPLNRTIKVWYAAFKRSPPAFCPSITQFELDSRCRSHSVQWELSHMCDGLTSCVINSTAIVRNEMCTGQRFLRMEYSCINGFETSSPIQTEFFLIGIAGVIALFAVAVMSLLVTVHFKKRRDSFPLTSLHAPLTEYENPEY